jgi:hypothetical protein
MPATQSQPVGMLFPNVESFLIAGAHFQRAAKEMLPGQCLYGYFRIFSA